MVDEFIPVNKPLLDGNIKKYLCECIEAGWISSEGPFVKQFEKVFSEFVGVRHGAAVCNGTAALETALYALGVQPGAEVVMPSFTIISCAIACIRLGAIPIFVDIDPYTWTMDVKQLESKITERTKVIMPVHIYGHPVEMDEVFRLKEKFGIAILEDFAEAHGAEYYSEYFNGKWLSCGSMGDASATSFYANKIITTGEGGMVLTSNEQIDKRAKSYRNLCFKPEMRFYHDELGYNFRMTNLQAAVGVAQLELIEQLLEKKRRIGSYYRQRLSGIKSIRYQIEKPWAHSVYWMYCIEILPDVGITAESLRQKLRLRGVGTRPFFMGLHRQPALQKLNLASNPEAYPNSDHAFKYGLYLPSGTALTEREVDIVCSNISEILG